MADKDELGLPSQLLLRHPDQLRGSRVLVTGLRPDNFLIRLSNLLPRAEVTAFSCDYAVYRYHQTAHVAAGFPAGNVLFGAFYPQPREPHDLAVVFLPKSRRLVELTLSMTAAVLGPRSPVLLVGENKAGIRSSRPILEQVIGPVQEVEAARHCVLYRAALSDVPSRFALDHWEVRYQIEVAGVNLTVAGFPGVFSHGRLDDGTRFLLENLELPGRGRVLDFGCGAGVIGALVKRLFPACEVDMVDSNGLALAAASRTMQANGLSANDIRPSDVFSDVPGAYTHIISNPPFHSGIATDYRVVAGFFEQAARHLAPRGCLYVVANRFLKYAPLIETYLGECRVVAQNSRYCVYAGRLIR